MHIPEKRRARAWEVPAPKGHDKFPYCRECEVTQEVAAYEEHCWHCSRVSKCKAPSFIFDCTRIGCSVKGSS